MIITRSKFNPINKCERFEQIGKFSELEKERDVRRFQAGILELGKIKEHNKFVTAASCGFRIVLLTKFGERRNLLANGHHFDQTSQCYNAFATFVRIELGEANFSRAR